MDRLLQSKQAHTQYSDDIKEKSFVHVRLKKAEKSIFNVYSTAYVELDVCRYSVYNAQYVDIFSFLKRISQYVCAAEIMRETMRHTHTQKKSMEKTMGNDLCMPLKPID